MDQSNLYSAQKNVNKPLNVSRAEIEQWIDLCIYFSIFKLPSCRMHWKTTMGYLRDYVAETMVRDRFEEIKSNIHLADNNGNDFTDKLFKVTPIVDHLCRVGYKLFILGKN